MKFYVYEVLSASDVIYVGKGSGRRMEASRRQRGGDACRAVAWFEREADAYAFEVKHIAALRPALNIHPGGNGSRVQAKRVRKSAFERLYDRIGSRALAARLLLAYAPRLGHVLSEVERIRRVAYG